ncbi:MAG: DciA family protein, partial [Rhodospirillaceae bacterium]
MSRRPAGKTSKSGARTPKAKAKSASVPSGGTPDKKVDGRASDPVLPKRSFTMLPIAQTGLKAARTAFHQRGFGGGALFEHWAEIVGPRLAARSCPEKLTRDRRTAVRGRDGRDSEGGTLHVKVSGGPAA